MSGDAPLDVGSNGLDVTARRPEELHVADTRRNAECWLTPAQILAGARSPDYAAWLPLVPRQSVPVLVIAAPEDQAVLLQDAALGAFLTKSWLCLAAWSWYEATRLGVGVAVLPYPPPRSGLYVPVSCLDAPGAPTAPRAKALRQWLCDGLAPETQIVAQVAGRPCVVMGIPGPEATVCLLEDVLRLPRPQPGAS